MRMDIQVREDQRDWLKSTFSRRGNCVEIQLKVELVPIRDSKFRGKTRRRKVGLRCVLSAMFLVTTAALLAPTVLQGLAAVASILAGAVLSYLGELLAAKQD